LKIQAIGLGFVMLALVAGCGGQEVTPERLKAARQTWQRARIDDYDLEWTSTGARNVHYRVFVRGGTVEAIYSVLPDGREIVAKPGEPKYFGVDGLFRTIDDDLAQLGTANPFGQPAGTKIVLRFKTDPTYGYPISYRCDVLGTPQTRALDVRKFVPNPGRAIPPPGPT
jgi:hypothetical protein